MKTQSCARGFFSPAAKVSSLRRWPVPILLAALLCAGCRREKITVYDIPKADGFQPESRLKYELPAGWQEQPPTGMSVALFSIADKKAELSIMSFPGEGASRLSLINIVRENVGLAPLSDEELSRLEEPVTVGAEKGSLIDLTGGTNTTTNTLTSRVLVAVLPHDGVTWFFKLAGASDVVTAQKPAMLGFLKSVSLPFGAVPSPHMADANAAPPPDTAPVDSTAALPGAGSAASGDKPAWEPPANWKEVPPTQMLLAKFVISATDGEADVTVSFFGGGAGGLLLNVNRWRGQVGLAPVDEAGAEKAATPLDVPGGKAMLVDVNGTSPKTGKETRIIGVVWPRGDQTWFYKLMGDSAVAGREKDALLKFIQSVRYPNA